MRAEIAGWEIAPDHVSMFGSGARGEGDARSDIDIFVVRPARMSEDDPRWRGQLEQLADHVYGWTGNHAGLSEISATDLRRLRRDHPPIVAELPRDAITLTGPSASELLERQRDEASGRTESWAAARERARDVPTGPRRSR